MLIAKTIIFRWWSIFRIHPRCVATGGGACQWWYEGNVRALYLSHTGVHWPRAGYHFGWGACSPSEPRDADEAPPTSWAGMTLTTQCSLIYSRRLIQTTHKNPMNMCTGSVCILYKTINDIFRIRWSPLKTLLEKLLQFSLKTVDIPYSSCTTWSLLVSYFSRVSHLMMRCQTRTRSSSVTVSPRLSVLHSSTLAHLGWPSCSHHRCEWP